MASNSKKYDEHFSGQSIFLAAPSQDVFLLPHITYGQSYKGSTIVNYDSVNYDSRVVIWGIFKSGTNLES